MARAFTKVAFFGMATPAATSLQVQGHGAPPRAAAIAQSTQNTTTWSPSVMQIRKVATNDWPYPAYAGFMLLVVIGLRRAVSRGENNGRTASRVGLAVLT